MGAGLGLAAGRVEAQPHSPEETRPATPLHTKAALRDLALIEAERPCLGKAATPPLSTSQGPRPVLGVGGGGVGCPAPTPKPHICTACPPPPQVTPAPGSHSMQGWGWGVTNRQQGAPGPLVLGALGGPITDLVPAWGLCTLTSCPPSQLRCHLLSSIPPSSGPPKMLPRHPAGITLIYLFYLQSWGSLAMNDFTFTASMGAESSEVGPRLPHSNCGPELTTQSCHNQRLAMEGTQAWPVRAIPPSSDGDARRGAWGSGSWACGSSRGGQRVQGCH